MRNIFMFHQLAILLTTFFLLIVVFAGFFPFKTTEFWITDYLSNFIAEKLLSKSLNVKGESTTVITPFLSPAPTEKIVTTGVCRRDCSFNLCPTGYTCYAVPREEGREIFSYQCFSNKCSPWLQDEECNCSSL